MDERIRKAAERLYRRGEDNGANIQRGLRHASFDEYTAAQQREQKRRQDAWDEFVAATTGSCVCGAPVAYPPPDLAPTGCICACGRKFVVG